MNIFKKNKRNYIKIDIKRNEVKEDEYNKLYERNEERENIISKEMGTEVISLKFMKAFYKFKKEEEY